MTTQTSRPHTMTAVVGVWLALAYTNAIDRARAVWERLADDSGVEDSPSKLLWLAVAVALAIAAGVFIIGVFNDARDGVPDPVAPAP